MFGFAPKLPISDEERRWVNQGFLRLENMVGRRRMLEELGHVILLGRGLMKADVPDMEPLTDLLTVFLGFGIFRANSALQFNQWQDDQRHGWSARLQGYLSEEVYGYALAKYALERNEDMPEWVKFLSTNVRAYFRRSQSWLARNREDKPIG